MKRKKSGGEGGANWMDTYGDMVTLLLCFFVMLYSMSVISEEKWIALVKSFNPNAVETPTETSGNDGANADEPNDKTEDASQEISKEQKEVDAAIEELYQAIKAYADGNQKAKDIEVTKGDGYVFVAFNESVFFNGDSYELLPQGEEVLGTFSDLVSNVAKYVDEIRVMGHTAQADPNTPNNPTTDRFLSASRAAIATVYIQEHCTVEPARIVSVGYGQHRPVDSNDTSESRSHNRRVEILITGKDLTDTLNDSIQKYYSTRNGTYTTDDNSSTTQDIANALQGGIVADSDTTNTGEVADTETEDSQTENP